MQLSSCIFVIGKYCVKRVPTQSFSGTYFPAFGLNTEIYRVILAVKYLFNVNRSAVTIFPKKIHHRCLMGF